MSVTVLMSSGDEDSWENVAAEVSMDLGGSLLIHANEDGKEEPGPVVAVYAPGMWMKFEVEQ